MMEWGNGPSPPSNFLPLPSGENSGRLSYSYVGVLISLWLFLIPLFLFEAQPKKFFLDGLKKLEQRSHKCVELRGGICRVNT
jgi:hypothetical protein